MRHHRSLMSDIKTNNESLVHSLTNIIYILYIIISFNMYITIKCKNLKTFVLYRYAAVSGACSS